MSGTTKIEVAAKSDVILLCGSGGATPDERFVHVPSIAKTVLTGLLRIAIHASSVILSTASPVFKALVNPCFKEGTELATSPVPIEIPLPEDDPQSMATLCKVLHYRNEDISSAPGMPASKILRIAEVSDKFDCNAAMKFAARVWLEESSNVCENADDRKALLKAAFLFGDCKMFAELGREVILLSVPPICYPGSSADEDKTFSSLFGKSVGATEPGSY